MKRGYLKWFEKVKPIFIDPPNGQTVNQCELYLSFQHIKAYTNHVKNPHQFLFMKILLVPYPSFGHCHAFLNVASQLQNHGHEIIVATDSKFQSIFSKHQLQCIPLSLHILYNHSLEYERISKIKMYKALLNDYLFDRFVKRVREKASFLIKRINVTDADLILVDRLLSNFLILSNTLRSKSIILNAMLNLFQTPYVPPINSNLSPEDPFFRLKNNFEWTKKLIRYYINTSKYLGQTPLKIAMKAADRKDLPFKIINPTRSSYGIGFYDVPELILSYKSLDFPLRSPLPVNLHYIGIQRRKNTILTTRDQEIIQEVSLLKKQSKSKIFYCCLGTVTEKNNRKALGFLKTLFSLFESRIDWTLIYSYGGINHDITQTASKNIKCYNFLPQASILPFCDVVISHGGLNTIIECIFNETPIIIFPFDKRKDHKGNAARVRFYNIGKVGNISTINQASLEKSLIKVAGNDDYKRALSKLKKSIAEEESSSLQKLLEILHRRISSAQNNK